MPTSYNKKAALLFLIAVFFITGDRILKKFSLILHPIIELVGDLFIFNYTKNYFIAFSIPLAGKWLISLIALVIIFLFAYTIHLLCKKSILAFPLMFTIIGAASNLYDRIVFGYVIDYFDLKYFTVFNLADTMISIGLLVFLLFLIKEKKLDQASL